MKQDYEKNWPGLPIGHLIKATQHFIVFLDKDLDIDWATNDLYDETEQTNIERRNNIMNLVAKLECVPTDHQPRSVRLNFKRMIGEAVVRNLEYDYASGEAMLANADEYIKERNAEQSRHWYLSASGATAFGISAIGFIAWYQRQWLMDVLGSTAFFLLLSSAAGAMGALLSVVMRLGKATLNPAAGKSIHYLEGFYRVVAGCVSAFLLALCVRLELLVPIFSKVEQTQVAMLLAGMIAGASERWAPSLISKVELGEGTNEGKMTTKEIAQT